MFSFDNDDLAALCVCLLSGEYRHDEQTGRMLAKSHHTKDQLRCGGHLSITRLTIMNGSSRISNQLEL